MINKNSSESELTLAYTDPTGCKATKQMIFTSKTHELDLINTVFSSLYNLLTIEIGLDTTIVDYFLAQVVEEDKMDNIDVEPTFKSIEDFTTLFNKDEGFKQFMFDFYKKTFCEE